MTRNRVALIASAAFSDAKDMDNSWIDFDSMTISDKETKKLVPVDAFIQTDKKPSSEVAIQAHITHDVMIQAEEKELSPLPQVTTTQRIPNVTVTVRSQRNTPAATQNNNQQESLRSFCKRVEKLMSEQLLQNLKSNAFADYHFRQTEDENDRNGAELRHTLVHANRDARLSPTSVSWNATGSSLAVGYGFLSHSDWCTHKGALCIWRIDARDLDPTRAEIYLETPSCLLCLQWHPTLPNLLLGGTFHGEILLWDLNRRKADDLLQSRTVLNAYSHQEPVTQLLWLSQQSRYFMSVALDGLVQIWDASHSLDTPIQRSSFRIDQVRLIGVEPSMRSYEKSKLALGFTCASLTELQQQESENEASQQLILVALGTEGGHVLQCRYEANVNTGNHVASSLPASLSHIVHQYRSHIGPVQSVQWSPLVIGRLPLLCTAGLDGFVRVYPWNSTFVHWQIQLGCAIRSLSWSQIHPMTLSIATEEESVQVYQLSQQERQLFISLPNPKVKQVQGHSALPMMINDVAHCRGRRVDYLAVVQTLTVESDDSLTVDQCWPLKSKESLGDVHIWRVNLNKN